MRDLLGLTISVGTVHHVLHSATRQADIINRQQAVSGIRVGLHDEIFHGATPVLAGVDANSTLCYLLATEHHRDSDTWGMHLRYHVATATTVLFREVGSPGYHPEP